MIELSPKDQRAFIEALFNAPEPCSRLLKAAEHYAEKVEKGEHTVSYKVTRDDT